MNVLKTQRTYKGVWINGKSSRSSLEAKFQTAAFRLPVDAANQLMKTGKSEGRYTLCHCVSCKTDGKMLQVH